MKTLCSGPQKLALLLSTSLVSPAIAQEVIELEPIVVEGASYETEDSDSYTTDKVSVGEKATMSPRQVPQSTSVVTNEQIKDGGYTALEEALAGTTGILIARNNVGRSSIFSRGFEFDYLYFNGLPAPVSSIYGTQPDLSIVDHVEVLKGPAGLFIGTGEPAGSINMRLKQASATEFTGSTSLSYDSNGQARAELDVADKLNADGTLRGRFVTAYGDGDSFVDVSENSVESYYGTLAWDISPDTTLTVSLTHMERDMTPYNGLPTYSDGSLIWTDVSATTAFDWNDFESTTTDAVAELEHFFANGGRVKFSLRDSDQGSEFLYGYAASAADDDNTIDSYRYLARDFSQHSLALDLHTELPFYLGHWEGNLILGADWQKLDSTMYQATGTGSATLDLDDWDSSAVDEPDYTYSSKTETDVISKGLYSQLRLSPIQNLTLIGGARLSWYDGDVDTTTLSTGDVSRESYDVDGQVTPFFGVTYDVLPSATLYASYSEIFEPQSVTDEDGDLLDPIEGQQYEVGVKAQLAYGLNVSAALFDLRQVNLPVASDDLTYYIADEEVRSRGLEVEFSGEATESLHMTAGYTYTDTEYLNGDSEGEVYSSITPKHMFKVTALYDVTEGAMQGWSFGGRVTSVSDFSSGSIEADGYTVIDALAKKEFASGVTVSLGVDNLFDKDYYERVGSTTVFNFRGEPRTFKIALSKEF